MKISQIKSNSLPVVVTNEFRISKRNLIADLIQANCLLKDLNEQLIMQKIRELENTIFKEHSANIHLYSHKIEKVVSLFKSINQNNYLNVAQKLRKSELDVKIIFQLLEKNKQLKEYEQSLLSKQVSTSEYDPLQPRQNPAKKLPTPLVANTIVITKGKPVNQQTSSSIASKPYQIFADFKELQQEPPVEKKVKQKQEQSDEDEIDIRINDGMQGAALLTVFCSKQVVLYDSKIKIPIYLLIQPLPQYRVLCEKIDFGKLHNSKDTIVFLCQNLERKIIFGQVLLKPSDYVQQLRDLSQKLVKQDKIIAQKFDNDNASFLILHKSQLEVILKARKQSLTFDATDMVIKEWSKQSSYLEWWAMNKQDHDLHFLIFFKNLSNTSEQNFERVTLQKPQSFPKIQQTIDSLLKQRDINDILQGFLQADLSLLQFDTNHKSQLESATDDENQKFKQDEVVVESFFQQKQSDEFEQISVEKELQQIDTNVKIPEEQKIQFKYKISDLALQLSKEDYF